MSSASVDSRADNQPNLMTKNVRDWGGRLAVVASPCPMVDLSILGSQLEVKTFTFDEREHSMDEGKTRRGPRAFPGF